jgi:hypothetical protein
MAKSTQRPPTASTSPWAIEQNAPNVHTITFTGLKAGWEQWVLLTSDRHHDNPHSRWDLEKQHLDEAAQRKALILDFGDLFCAMNGKYDPRRSLDNVRPEDKGDDYLDRIVNHAAEFYRPYAGLFAVIGQGNHETSVLGRVGTNLTDRLVDRLRQAGGRAQMGGYGGWVRFSFNAWKTYTQTKTLKYHHGAGGGGIMTHGVLDTRRMMSFLPDADIVVNGHTHDQYHVPLTRERLTKDAVVARDIVHHIRLGTYKDEYADGRGGYHIEKGRPPKPLGAAWLRFYVGPQERERVQGRRSSVVSGVSVDVVLSTA